MSIELKSLLLKHNCEYSKTNEFYEIRKWNFDYQDYLNLLEDLVFLLRENKELKIMIICSHPHCYTNGSGLQRNVDDLVHLNQEDIEKLDLPFYQIKRGGGLTFHHPSQIIIYPLINLNHKKISLTKLMLRTLQATQSSLEKTFDIKSLSYKEKMLGLWHLESMSKVASIGMGLDRFITTHGMALNLNYDEKMDQSLKKLNPCGITSSTYKSIAETIKEPISLSKRDELIENFLQNFKL